MKKSLLLINLNPDAVSWTPKDLALFQGSWRIHLTEVS